MRRIARILLLASAFGTLAACQSETPEPAPTTQAEAAPENAPGITLGQARVQLPVVPGRPAVAYFTLSQANGAPRAVAAVHVDGAGRAEMHQTMQDGAMSTMKPVASVAIKPGETLRFEPGGFHVMLFDLEPALAQAKETELTVTFDGGDKASVNAAVGTLAQAAEHAH